MRHWEMLFSGSGGQGLLFIGKLLAHVAVDEYPYVTFLPTYGAEVRSGTSYCHVKMSDEPIASPQVEAADAMVLMNQPSVDRFLPRLASEKVAFVNSTMATADAGNVVLIPATETALECGDVQAANVVMLGALLGCRGVVEREKALAAVEDVSKRKGEAAVAINRLAFERGLDLAASAQGQAAS